MLMHLFPTPGSFFFLPAQPPPNHSSLIFSHLRDQFLQTRSLGVILTTSLIHPTHPVPQSTTSQFYCWVIFRPHTSPCGPGHQQLPVLFPLLPVHRGSSAQPSKKCLSETAALLLKSLRGLPYQRQSPVVACEALHKTLCLLAYHKSSSLPALRSH